LYRSVENGGAGNEGWSGLAGWADRSGGTAIAFVVKLTQGAAIDGASELANKI